MEQKKTVCVVGAGPSGLVTAKTLLHDHPGVFDVHIFEQTDHVGGLWPISPDDSHGKVNPDMCTNQSRFTVKFSDLAWDEKVPMFPKAWQVGQYLKSYIEAYLKDPEHQCKISTGHSVVEVYPPASPTSKWKVLIRKGQTGVVEHLKFDHVVIASGFFGKPKVPKILGDFTAPISHTSDFRNLKSMLTGNGKLQALKGSKIVVVGGQMSGVETAAAIAIQLSAAVNEPSGINTLPSVEKYTIHHVVQRPFWVMPLFFPQRTEIDDPDTDGKKPEQGPPFLPLDLVSYNLGFRPPGPLQNTSGDITPEAANTTSNFMNNTIGSDQSDFGSKHLTMVGDIRSKQPWLTCSDHYTEFVRSKSIITHMGKVVGAAPDSDSAILIQNENQTEQLEDVAAVVFATGFEAAASIASLSHEILEKLQFDAASSEFPLALNVHSSVNKSLPSLGFVGFYRSPYWGVMEMQARYLGKLWTGDSQALKTLAEDDTLSKMIELRTSDRRAQFPMGDYAYLMESFGNATGIELFQDPPGPRSGLLIPDRYLSNTASSFSQRQRDITMNSLSNVINLAAGSHTFLARAVFRGMQGDWKVERSLDSRIASYPSGKFSGTAKFLPRVPTGEEGEYDLEYLYVEEGDFKTETGLAFRANRRYAYRYTNPGPNSGLDKLSVWFVKPDNKTIDYLFHEFQFQDPLAPGKGWRAKAHHLCIDDTYDVEYEFCFRGATLQRWTMEYLVRGPQKDYTIRSVYGR